MRKSFFHASLFVAAFSATSLSQQKRDILYNNAARFLRLEKAEAK